MNFCEAMLIERAQRFWYITAPISNPKLSGQTMTDSTIQPEETLSFKEQYENAIDKSDHLPAAKIIGEFVLDALINSSGESQKIRELREQIKTAIGNADDDAAHELMVELKTIKDAEQESAAALTEISSKFSISQILSSFRQDPAFQ